VGQQGTISLRVELPNYQNQSLIKTVTIPIVTPEAIIEAPFFNNEFSWSPITLFARGYFFNTQSFSELLPSWLINGVTPESSGDPESLTLNIDPSLQNGTRITVNLEIGGKGGVAGSASSQKTIILHQ
jgi:hypothetical protein